MELKFFLDNYFLWPFLMAGLSVFFFEIRKEKLSLFILFLTSVTLGLLMVRLDPFINLWDEQFHALVAKSLIKNPLKPILIEQPIFGVIESYWSYCKIWMHKQPLFLWQIALSMKMFGLNELGVRFPSILMNAIMIIFIYRIGKIFVSKKVGYYSALLFSFSYFPSLLCPFRAGLFINFFNYN